MWSTHALVTPRQPASDKCLSERQELERCARARSDTLRHPVRSSLSSSLQCRPSTETVLSPTVDIPDKLKATMLGNFCAHWPSCLSVTRCIPDSDSSRNFAALREVATWFNPT